MAKKSDQKEELPEGDPERGDALLKRMLKTPPKQHKDMKKGAGKTPGKLPAGKGKPAR
jgi:hypothetical protein